MNRPAPVPPPAGPAWRLLLGLAGVKLLLHVALGNRYGFHRDELYYLACGQRPDWGYVDHPPLVPMLGRLVEAVFGGSTGLTPGELRLPAALAGAGTVLLTGLMARELGGGRAAQGFAALAALCAPLFLSAGGLFQSVVFDQFLWALAVFLTLRTLRTGEGRGWLGVGVVAGVGLETKHTMALLGLGLAVGLLGTRTGRQHLRTPWPWAGGAVALGLFLPNVLWQMANGWPTAEFVRNNNANVREAGWSAAGFLGEQALFVGPLLLPVAAMGLWRAWRDDAGRMAGIVFLTTAAVLLLVRGKPYYLGAAVVPVLALGGVALAAFVARRGPGRPWLVTALAGVMALNGAASLPVTLPVWPRDALAGSFVVRVNEGFAEMFGWEELGAQVRALREGLPADERGRAAVLTSNYGEAAAVSRFIGVPAATLPVASRHNSYWGWGPPPAGRDVLIVIGFRRREWLEERFGEVTPAGEIGNAAGLDNEERGRLIFLCRHPRRPLAEAWAEWKAFD